MTERTRSILFKLVAGPSTVYPVAQPGGEAAGSQAAKRKATVKEAPSDVGNGSAETEVLRT